MILLNNFLSLRKISTFLIKNTIFKRFVGSKPPINSTSIAPKKANLNPSPLPPKTIINNTPSVKSGLNSTPGNSHYPSTNSNISFNNDDFKNVPSPIDQSNTTFGDGKMSPMQFATKQAIHNARVSALAHVEHKERALVHVENKERALVVYQNKPSTPLPQSQQIWLVDKTGNTFLKTLPITTPPPLPPAFDIWDPSITYVTPGGSKYEVLPKCISYTTNKSGKLIETIVGINTTENELQLVVILNELRRREMVKDDEYTQKSFKTIDGSYVIIGTGDHGVKLTPFGAIYHKIVRQKNQTFAGTSLPNPKVNIPNGNIQIVAPICSNPGITLIKTADSKHVYPAILQNGYYESPGFLTGSNVGMFLHHLKFSDYQKMCEGLKNFTQNLKKQRIVEFEHIRRIPKNQAIVLAHGTEYLEHIGQMPYIINRFKLLKDTVYEDITFEGISLKEAVNMCKEHDYNVANKIPHPKTAHQLKQDADNKQKQKDFKNKKNDNNDAEKNNAKSDDTIS